jgi:hypothetical protein
MNHIERFVNLDTTTITIRLQPKGFLMYMPEWDQLTVEPIEIVPTADTMHCELDRR